MKNNALPIVIATAATATITLGIQFAALLTLQSVDYGLFSLGYLLGAFALSLQLSIISEAWSRAEHSGDADDWTSYSTASVEYAILAGIIVAAVCAMLPGLRESWWIAAVAVIAGTYRASARFYSLRRLEWRFVLAGDVAGAITAMFSVIALLAYFEPGLRLIIIVWSVTMAASAVASKPPSVDPSKSLSKWIRRHWQSIKPLVRDSIIMDAAAIGTPYAIAPILGVSSFGVYRAVSNIAAPVRLLLNPLRPRVSVLGYSALRSRKTLSVVLGASLMAGLGGAGALSVIHVLGLEVGTLSPLAAYALPTGIFVAFNCLGHAYYIIARFHVAGVRIAAGRVCQTVTAIIFPIFGALFGGLDGAIWAYAMATVCSSIAWMILVRLKPL